MKDDMSILDEITAEKQELSEQIARDAKALEELAVTERVVKRLSGAKAATAVRETAERLLHGSTPVREIMGLGMPTNGAAKVSRGRPRKAAATIGGHAPGRLVISGEDLGEIDTEAAKPGRGRPRKAAATTVTTPLPEGAVAAEINGKSVKPTTPTIDDQVLAKIGPAGGITKTALIAALPGARPNHIGIALARHIRAGRLSERGGVLYRGLMAEQHSAD